MSDFAIFWSIQGILLILGIVAFVWLAFLSGGNGK
jgi:hypothetical protein